MEPFDRHKVLSWFTGKARAKAEGALDLLERSAAQSGWVPGASSKVRAALSKANIAINLGTKHSKALDLIGEGYDTPRAKRGWEVKMLLQYGYNARAREIDFGAIRAAAPPELRMVVEQAARFADDMAPAAAVIERLDATRPVPVFTSLGLSPTVTSTLASLGLDGSASSVRVCEIEWEEIRTVDDRGRETYRKVGRLLWPAGTVHRASRHARSHSARYSLCEACGHPIRNPYNWVPLLIDNNRGVPHSLWVGRDCARNLFGFKVQGVVELDARPGTEKQ